MPKYTLGYNIEPLPYYPYILGKLNPSTYEHDNSGRMSFPQGNLNLHLLFPGIPLDMNMGYYLRDGGYRFLLNSVGLVLADEINKGPLVHPLLISGLQDEQTLLPVLGLGDETLSKVILLRIIGPKLQEFGDSSNPMIPRLAERVDACHILEQLASVKPMDEAVFRNLMGTITGACIAMRRAN